jgi:hypothetical protein
MNTDKAREFLQTNSPTLYDWLFDKDMPAGIDDMICLVMEQYDNRDKWISVKNPPKEFEEVLIAYKYNSVPVQAYLKNGIWMGSDEVTEYILDVFTNDRKLICQEDIYAWTELPNPPKNIEIK